MENATMFERIAVTEGARRVIFLKTGAHHGISADTIAVRIGSRYFGTHNGDSHWYGNSWWRTDQHGTDGLLHSAYDTPEDLPEKFQDCHVGYHPQKITIGRQIFYV